MTKWSLVVNRIDSPEQIAWKQWRLPVVNSSTGEADAGSIPMLGQSGTLDPSFLGGITGIQLKTDGVLNPVQNILNLIGGANITLTSDGSGGVTIGGEPSGINQLTGDVMAGPGTGTQVSFLKDIGVVSGSYTNANITVDSKGRVTEVSSGTTGVSSVALSMPSEFSISGSPITSSGTFTVTKTAQPVNSVYAGPESGNPDLPSFRALTSSDLPVATTSSAGATKPDGTTLAAANDGTLSVIPQSNTQYPINSLVTGGGVVWISGYTFTVSAATYIINGIFYSSPLTTITLSPASPTLDRIDVIVLDTTGAVTVLEGTPAPNPQQPVIDPSSQLELTFVYVAAASTSPTQISSSTIYDDNSEWTTSGSSSFNFSDTSHPYHGTKDLFVNNGTSGDSGQFLSGSMIDPTKYNNLAFYLQSGGSWSKNKSLQFQWLDGSTLVGSAVALKDGAFNFSSSNTASYQQIVIPISSFAIPTGTSINTLKITISGGGSSVSFYADMFVLQAGTNTTPQNISLVWRGAWNSTYAFAANDVATSGGYSWVALQPSVNTLPVEGNYWTKLATLNGITQLSGDVTTSIGSGVATLTNSGVSAGTYSNATVTVDSKGRVTSASNGTIQTPVTLRVTSSSTLSTGNTFTFPQVDFSGVIVGWVLTADVVGTVSIDVWKVASSAPPNAPTIPTSANKITANSSPSLSGSQSASQNSAGLAGWTTSVAKWDVFGFDITSASSVKSITLQIWIQRV